MSTNYCPSCGFETRGAKYCPDCGAAVIAPQSEEAEWVGPLVWALFLGGILVAIIGAGTAFGIGGAVAMIVGFVGIVATGRVMPSSRGR